MFRIPISHLTETSDVLNQCRRLEWLETNGIGGFASSTVLGLNTRRYHGLLVAATRPPVGRILTLAKLEETLLAQDSRYELSANQYPDVVHPRGFEFLAEFRKDLFPTYIFRVGQVEIAKTVFLVHGRNEVCVEYELRSLGKQVPTGYTLEIRPLIAFRDYHSATHRNDGLSREVSGDPALLRIRPYVDLPELFLSTNASESRATGDWYFNLQYQAERERGLDFEEDLFNPVELRFQLEVGKPARLIASLEICSETDFDALRSGEIRRREKLLGSAAGYSELVQELTLAADQFIVGRGDGESVIAGYPWFSDWGRDTMIALPGLTLSTGRPRIAAGILKTFARNVSEGMLPNRFPDAGEVPEYNTVDATLWFFEAVRAYLEYTGDHPFVRADIYPALVEIIDCHIRGTRYGIRTDDDGLLRCGSPGAQLTWMDAKVGDWVVTPRHGKPVEIQALWYNALRIMEELARTFNDIEVQKRCGQYAQRAMIAFRPSFWNREAGCLYDVVDDGPPDNSIRPNQLFAVSLKHSMLNDEDASAVLNVVARELYTPIGLRSLAPGDPQYRPVYQGGVAQRDGAYHQGTVWPWLFGAFTDAWMRVHGDSPETREQIDTWLRSMETHLRDGCIGQISEIADADPPHFPKGCPAQAWSVSEVLRVAKAYAAGNPRTAVALSKMSSERSKVAAAV